MGASGSKTKPVVGTRAPRSTHARSQSTRRSGGAGRPSGGALSWSTRARLRWGAAGAGGSSTTATSVASYVWRVSIASVPPHTRTRLSTGCSARRAASSRRTRPSPSHATSRNRARCVSALSLRSGTTSSGASSSVSAVASGCVAQVAGDAPGTATRRRYGSNARRVRARWQSATHCSSTTGTRRTRQSTPAAPSAAPLRAGAARATKNVRGGCAVHGGAHAACAASVPTRPPHSITLLTTRATSAHGPTTTHTPANTARVAPDALGRVVVAVAVVVTTAVSAVSADVAGGDGCTALALALALALGVLGSAATCSRLSPALPRSGAVAGAGRAGAPWLASSSPGATNSEQSLRTGKSMPNPSRCVPLSPPAAALPSSLSSCWCWCSSACCSCSRRPETWGGSDTHARAGCDTESSERSGSGTARRSPTAAHVPSGVASTRSASSALLLLLSLQPGSLGLLSLGPGGGTRTNSS